MVEDDLDDAVLLLAELRATECLSKCPEDDVRGSWMT
jgi:hypothetical protein